jgi:hypothetical protein
MPCHLLWRWAVPDLWYVPLLRSRNCLWRGICLFLRAVRRQHLLCLWRHDMYFLCHWLDIGQRQSEREARAGELAEREANGARQIPAHLEDGRRNPRASKPALTTNTRVEST